jgi:hypothetical protein
MRSLGEDVPALHDVTLYVLLGDWFTRVVLAALAFALVQIRRLSRQ